MGKPKQWEKRFSRDDTAEEIQAIASALNLTPLTASLLYHRGCQTPEMARRFVRIEAENLGDPFAMTDMRKAAMRVLEGIAAHEQIVIYGDYDADGVTATTLLYLYLKKAGAWVDYFIPDRFRDGYGMNERAVRELISQGNRLIITVDNGITATEPIALACSLGATVIVTDHHEPHDDLPEAYAVVDPHREGDAYSFKALAGVGVAFKLICAIEALRGEDPHYLRTLCYAYLDLVAFGTVADVMPLVGENRLIVSMGLHIMNHSPRPGIKALVEQAGVGGKPLSASAISFSLAPRVNAAGRLASAMRAVELLLSVSETDATRLAAELCAMNQERQSEENAIFLAATERIRDTGSENAPILVLDHDDWHAGVTGIVASRVTERYARPSFLITYDGKVGKGSGRSVPGVNLMSLLASCSDLLIQYGGHEMAAGLTIERDRVEAFRARITEAANEAFPSGIPMPTQAYDCEISMEDVTQEQILQLSYLEPTGCENPSPVFLLPHVRISQMTAVGQNKNHTSFRIGMLEPLNAIYFGVSPESLEYAPGDTVDLLTVMNLNTFGGRTTPQLQIKDICHTASAAALYEKTETALSDFLAGNDGALSLSALPTRDDLARVWRVLSSLVSVEEEKHLSLRSLASKALCVKTADTIAKTALSLSVFAQTPLMTLHAISPGTADTGTASDFHFAVTLHRQNGKIDLAASPLFARITRILSTKEPERNP